MFDPKPNWTGERLETFITDQTMLEHLHRYALTFEFINGKRVLDIACGEGYGTNLMAKYAAHVTGVDINLETIQKAKNKYQNKNIEFIEGSILNIPSKDSYFDIITCFETLEHIEEHNILLNEIKRVLRPDGLLIISTPDKINYKIYKESKNSFHKKEITEIEFKTLVNEHFKHSTFYKQSSYSCSIIQHPDICNIENYYTGDYINIESYSPKNPHYWISLSSDSKKHEIKSSLFHHKFSLSDLLRQEAELVKKTYTYKIGNFIIFPFKLIRNLFKR